jgi:putative protease
VLAETPTAHGGVPPAPSFDRRRASQLISLKDLAAFQSISALADAGVEAFKIEGRLKGPEYVAEVVRLYRAALDAWEEGRGFSAAEAERSAGRVFARGFTNGYLAGRVEGSMRGDKRLLEGECDLTVLSANRTTGVLVLEPRPGHPIRAGQGYRYAHDRYVGGFRVLSARAGASGAVLAKVRFGAEARGRSHRRGASGRRRPPPPLPEGLACFLNDDPELEARVERLVESVRLGEGPTEVPLRLVVAGRPGEPLRLRGETSDGRAAEVSSSEVLQVARTRTLTDGILSAQLGRLGGTRYRLEAIDARSLAREAFLGLSVLNALRRALVAELDAADSSRAGRRASGPSLAVAEVVRRSRETELAVTVGDPASLEAAIAAGVARVTVAELPLRGAERAWEARWLPAAARGGGPGAGSPSAASARSASGSTGPRLELRLPPIGHDEEDDRRALDWIASALPGWGILAGHLGQVGLAAERGLAVSADLYLNAYSHRTVELLAEAGAGRVVLSPEVDAREAARVAGRVREGIGVEVVVGGALPSMLTRQAYGIEPGRSFLATSEHGHSYRFEASPRGFTLLYEARELVGAPVLPELAGALDAVRLDLSHHGAAPVGAVAAAYARALGALLGGGPAEEPLREACATHARHAPWGVFEGHLVRGARTQD